MWSPEHQKVFLLLLQCNNILLIRLNQRNHTDVLRKKIWCLYDKMSCGRCGAVVRQRCGHGHTGPGPAGVPPREAAGAGPGSGAAQETLGTVRPTEAPSGRSQAGNYGGRAGQRKLLEALQTELLYTFYSWHKHASLESCSCNLLRSLALKNYGARSVSAHDLEQTTPLVSVISSVFEQRDFDLWLCFFTAHCFERKAARARWGQHQLFELLLKTELNPVLVWLQALLFNGSLLSMFVSEMKEVCLHNRPKKHGRLLNLLANKSQSYIASSGL